MAVVYSGRTEGLHDVWLLSLQWQDGGFICCMTGCFYNGRIEGLHAAWLLSLQWQDRGSTCCMAFITTVAG